MLKQYKFTKFREIVSLMGQCHEFSISGFLHGSVFPVSTTPAELVAKFAAGVVDTGGAP